MIQESFIKKIIEEDKASGKWNGRVCTRFPPEPNGHLHIGHAKSLFLNYGIAQDYEGTFHLRFDDTNPEKESELYVESIKRDLQWLGVSWGENLFFASDYFEQLYGHAVTLIKKKKAYVDDLSPDKIGQYKGDLKRGGKNSPFRSRSIQENLDLFSKMKEGKFQDAEKCLRAKIDMNSPNINMRDPVLYRIRHRLHYRTRDKWCVYPTYDFTHPLSDSIEKITHSLCTLEFEDHRPFYDWICNTLNLHHPRQIEFARLNLDHTIMSKRLLLQLVEKRLVAGWDDPRLPTLAGLRRRGYSPESIKHFCNHIGVTKKESFISMATLESTIRDHLNLRCQRRFAVVYPLKVTVMNWEGEDCQITVNNHPLDASQGQRTLSFGKSLYIEREDFNERPPKNYFRLAPGKSIRLKYAYILQYLDHVKDEWGKVVEVKCTYLKDSLGGITPKGVKRPKSIVNWLSVNNADNVKLRLYGRLLLSPTVDRERLQDSINPGALNIVHSKIEKDLLQATIGESFQFERQGYFRKDEDSLNELSVFNRVVSLKDTRQ